MSLYGNDTLLLKTGFRKALCHLTTADKPSQFSDGLKTLGVHSVIIVSYISRVAWTEVRMPGNMSIVWLYTSYCSIFQVKKRLHISFSWISLRSVRVGNYWDRIYPQNVYSCIIIWITGMWSGDGGRKELSLETLLTLPGTSLMLSSLPLFHLCTIASPLEKYSLKSILYLCLPIKCPPWAVWDSASTLPQWGKTICSNTQK